MQKVVLFSGVPHTPRDKLNEAIRLIAFGNRFEDRSMTPQRRFIMLYALGAVVAAAVTAREYGSEPGRLSAEVLWQLDRVGGPDKTLAEAGRQARSADESAPDTKPEQVESSP